MEKSGQGRVLHKRLALTQMNAVHPVRPGSYYYAAGLDSVDLESTVFWTAGWGGCADRNFNLFRHGFILLGLFDGRDASILLVSQDRFQTGSGSLGELHKQPQSGAGDPGVFQLVHKEAGNAGYTGRREP